MGQFITAEEVRALSIAPNVKAMTTQQIDNRLIDVGERMIEEWFNLQLNTDAVPSNFDGYFDRRPEKKVEFDRDFKNSLLLVIDRMAINLNGYARQSVRGANVTFGRTMPPEVRMLMNRWAEPPRLTRGRGRGIRSRLFRG